jgi:hypothetical protein
MPCFFTVTQFRRYFKFSTNIPAVHHLRIINQQTELQIAVEKTLSNHEKAGKRMQGKPIIRIKNDSSQWDTKTQEVSCQI